MVIRKIYISQAMAPFAGAELDRLLAVSRRNNAMAGVTGILIFHERQFFQVLEGPRQNVRALYARICRDPRHESITMIEDGSARERAFGAWKMGFARPETLDSRLRGSLLSIYDLVPPDSEARGADRRARGEVRNFLAGFKYLTKPQG